MGNSFKTIFTITLLCLSAVIFFASCRSKTAPAPAEPTPAPPDYADSTQKDCV